MQFPPLYLLLPAISLSIIIGALSPLFTWVIGITFQAFADYPSPPIIASPEQNRHLLSAVGKTSLYYLALAVSNLFLEATTYTLWNRIAELVSNQLRMAVWNNILLQKDMAWFDLGLAAEGEGAAGLGSRFNKQTDEVRLACGVPLGSILSNLVTFIACISIAFWQSWSLTLVILSTVPILVGVQSIVSIKAIPLYQKDRDTAAAASGGISRIFSHFSSVKAFSAGPSEISKINNSLELNRLNINSLNLIYGSASGINTTLTLIMFVQGFWFGQYLLRNGHASPQSVLTALYACLAASSSLQSILPLIASVEHGYRSWKSLRDEILNRDLKPKLSVQELKDPRPSTSPLTVINFTLPRRKGREMRKLCPDRCKGEIELKNLVFSYPSRPEIRVLDGVNMYFPAGETTYVLGGSGSGKSTIGNMLLRLYEPEDGDIILDDQSYHHLDVTYTRESVAVVSQSVVLFPLTIHENVSIGLKRPVTRSEVVEACTFALMDQYIQSLPEGYNTILGEGGTDLSGGQRQRLSIARARIRDAPILILDEATSALDPISRQRIHESMKLWRRNKTTIVITHDLTQVGLQDFVYVMKEGKLAEQGFRADLEINPVSAFSELKILNLRKQYDISQVRLDSNAVSVKTDKHLSKAQHRASARRTWRGSTHFARAFDSVMINPRSSSSLENLPDYTSQIINEKNQSTFESPAHRHYFTLGNSRSPFSDDFETPELSYSMNLPIVGSDELRYMEEETMKVKMRRSHHSTSLKRRHHPIIYDEGLPALEVDSHIIPTVSKAKSLLHLFKLSFLQCPTKFLLSFSYALFVVEAACTPLFSYFLANLVSKLADPINSGGKAKENAIIVIIISVVHGLCCTLTSCSGAVAAGRWINSVREKSLNLAFKQDKTWVDRPENSAGAILQLIIKDGDDASGLIVGVFGNFLMVAAMISIATIWALIKGWALTLIGLALVPVVGVILFIQSRIVAKLEVAGKIKREQISRTFLQMVNDIRCIRSMTLEGAFTSKYEKTLQAALQLGYRSGFVFGIGQGAIGSLIYCAQGFMFYIGAVLIANGTYTFARMLSIFSLIVFALATATSLLGMLPNVTRIQQATSDFNRLMDLPTSTSESDGDSKPSLSGNISFSDVSFAYAQRPLDIVLEHLNLEFKHGKSTVICGTSGSGKSTIASLLQRLYTCSVGSIQINGSDIQDIDLEYLRSNLSVVSQSPALFDRSIRENIIFGLPHPRPCQSEIENACREANVHDFILSLPEGYETNLGENGQLFSGGQGQRLSIARALLRPCKIRILDECTSALDTDNQTAVLKSLLKRQTDVTTIVISHKVDVMRMCDEIILLEGGKIKEQGTYSSLMLKQGAFHELALSEGFGVSAKDRKVD